jgi:hypothetical protein
VKLHLEVRKTDKSTVEVGIAFPMYVHYQDSADACWWESFIRIDESGSWHEMTLWNDGEYEFKSGEDKNINARIAGYFNESGVLSFEYKFCTKEVFDAKVAELVQLLEHAAK